MTDDHAMLKQLKKTKFPKSFSQSVNLGKINIPVLSEWTEEQITSILGFEDEIVQSTAINLFFPNSDETSSASNKTKIDPKRAQLNLVGFLGGKEAASFAQELWEMMVDAQTAPHGIPRKLLDKKKEELEAEDNAQTAHKQQQQEQERPPEMDEWAKEALRRADHARQVLYGMEQHHGAEAHQPPIPAAAAVPEQQRPRPVSPPPPHSNEIEEENHEKQQSHHRRRNNNEDKSRSSRWDHNNNNNSSVSRSRSRSRSNTPEPSSSRQRKRSNSSDYDNSVSTSSSGSRRYREEDHSRRSKKKSKKKKKRRSSRSRERSRKDR